MDKNKEYIKFLNDLKNKIKQDQYQASYRTVNKEST